MSDKNGGFVQGTPVHTKEGLRPIEQIKVGDYVLAKPESGEGDAEYKRVTKTFEHHDEEIVLVEYKPAVFEEDGSVTTTHDSRDYFIATPNHPLWLKGKKKSNGDFEPVNKWVPVKDIFDGEVLGSGGGMVLALADGRLATVTGYGGGGFIPVIGRPDTGMLYSGGSISFGDDFECYDFSSGKPTFTDWEYINPSDLDELLTTGPVMIDGAEEVRTYPKPYLRTVYNIEVEDHHTFCVGDYGVLVRAQQ